MKIFIFPVLGYFGLADRVLLAPESLTSLGLEPWASGSNCQRANRTWTLYVPVSMVELVCGLSQVESHLSNSAKGGASGIWWS